MEYLKSELTLKINKNKAIGNIVFVVEGNTDEFALLKKIFHYILGYVVIKKSRVDKDFEEYIEFANPNNKNSKVLIINSYQSSIKHIKDSRKYLDDMFRLLSDKFKVKIKFTPVFYIWDRDYKSNKNIKALFPIFNCPYGNEMYEINGLLLLSYPCLESYIVSNFVSDLNSNVLYKELAKLRLQSKKDNILKQYNQDKRYRLQDMNDNTLLNACSLMLKMMKKIGLKEFRDIHFEDFSQINEEIYNLQEEFYQKNSYYKLLSLISIALLELQIIYVG